MNKEFLDLLDKSKKIHETKNQDYTSGNVDENFHRMAIISEWFNDPLDRVFATMVAVKLARLATLLNKSTTPEHESVDDSFLDLFTYVGLWGANYMRRFRSVSIEGLNQWNKDSNIIEDIALLHTENIGTKDGHLIIKDQRNSREAFSKSLESKVGEFISDRPMIIPECREEKIINPKEQKVNELVNMYDQLTDADYAKILSTARILVMRKS